MNNTFTTIPQIDLSPLFDNHDDGFLEVAQKIRQIYTDVGFAYLVNHNISQEIIDNAFLAAKHFHSMPMDEKNKIKQNEFFRGYLSRQSSILKSSGLEEAKKPNENEAFIIMNEVDENSIDYKNKTNLAGPNQWPDCLFGFKDTVLQYNNAMLSLATKLVRVFSLAFGMQQHDLDQYFINPTTCLRLQHYPKQPDIIHKDQFGLAPHTDYGFMTILAQDENSGLQVKNQLDNWVDVPPIRGSFVLNSGDILKMITNNYFQSTKHRVINRTGKSRYSIPFFFDPNMHAKISPLPIFCSPESPATHEAMEFYQHVMAKVKANYNISK